MGGGRGGGVAGSPNEVREKSKKLHEPRDNFGAGIFEVVSGSSSSFYGAMLCNLSQTTGRNVLKIRLGRGKELGGWCWDEWLSYI